MSLEKVIDDSMKLFDNQGLLGSLFTALYEEAIKTVYADIYRMAQLVPLISVLGVVFVEVLKRRPL